MIDKFYHSTSNQTNNMSSRTNNSNNKTSRSSRGGRGRGRGRGGRGGRGRNNYKKEVRVVPKYDGPIVGSEAYSKLHTVGIIHTFDHMDSVDRNVIPFAFSQDKSNDRYFQNLQQKMMDFGWRMNADENGNTYFTHPTYQGEKYTVYTHNLVSGSTICLPMVDRDSDPKGLGCSIVYDLKTGYTKVETNEWQSYWSTRKGRRRAEYLNYLDARKKKRAEYVEMSKKDKSVIVWEKDTPRCNPETWRDEPLSFGITA